MEYNKLVRDKIPALMEAQGKRPETRILSGEEYTRRLEQKLDEETAEFHADHSIEELADILEVVLALAEDMGCGREDLMKVYSRKHEARGGFREGIFLIRDDT